MTVSAISPTICAIIATAEKEVKWWINVHITWPNIGTQSITARYWHLERHGQVLALRTSWPSTGIQSIRPFLPIITTVHTAAVAPVCILGTLFYSEDSSSSSSSPLVGPNTGYWFHSSFSCVSEVFVYDTYFVSDPLIFFLGKEERGQSLYTHVHTCENAPSPPHTFSPI